ncbi:MAG: RNase adapter RapZ [Actinomycetota bacterium]
MAKKNGSVEFVIITGLSGAGKSQAMHVFEDLGYFCIDNLPPALIPRVAELVALPGNRRSKVALVIDVRGGKFFDALWDSLRDLKAMQIEYRIMFLDASDETLVSRFKETRRRHPLAKGGEVSEGVARERTLLSDIKEAANVVIDTSGLASQQLKQKIVSRFRPGTFKTALAITVLSFGYKFGVPMDADIVMDVRFLPNPYYEDKLRHLTGENKRVKKFVLDRPVAVNFLKKSDSLLTLLLPNYAREGKTHFTVALGCTGGRHRSVALAEEVSAFLKGKGYNVILRHRDIIRDNTPKLKV